MITMMIKALKHKDNDNDDVSNKQSHSPLIHHPSMPISFIVPLYLHIMYSTGVISK